MTKISATIVADSKNQLGNRLTTFVITFPRYILAEFNTHRMLSKNSASSRAIPFKKMVKSVEENPFIPLAWMKDHTGMQGNQYFEGWRAKVIQLAWIAASKSAIFFATKLSKLGLTKQLANRLLEPFMWHTVIVTGTEFENFFSLRCSEFADIHIQKLAYEMLDTYNASTPKELKDGEWHIPFGDQFDDLELYTLIEADHGVYDPILTMQELGEGISPQNQELIDNYKIKIAIARCARISYTLVGEESKKPDYAADIKLVDRLSSSGHYSPFEHVARGMDLWEYQSLGTGDMLDETLQGWSGNFRGFVQYRKTLANENRKDTRVLKK